MRQTPSASRPNNDVVGVNRYVWSQVIAKQNPNSVFLNYELVNTLWSNQNTTIQPGARTPLVAEQLSPGLSQEPVASTMMETYVQSLTCPIRPRLATLRRHRIRSPPTTRSCSATRSSRNSPIRVITRRRLDDHGSATRFKLARRIMGAPLGDQQ